MNKRIVKDFLYEELTYKIRGAIFNVYNRLGFGHKEVVYQRALAIEFDKLKIPYKREPKIIVLYEGESVGKYIPDFLIEDKIIIKLKSAYITPPNLDKQLVNYLKSTDYKLALAVNFGQKTVEIKRKVWTSKSVESVVKSV